MSDRPEMNKEMANVYVKEGGDLSLAGSTTDARTYQLQIAAEVSAAITSILELSVLLPKTVTLLCEKLTLYYVGVFLREPRVDEPGERLVLLAMSGEEMPSEWHVGYRLNLDDTSMIGACVLAGEPCVVSDLQSPDHRDSLSSVLVQARSAMILPLSNRGRVLGALCFYDKQPAAFANMDIAVFQNIANQLADTVANAQLFDEMQMALAEAETLYRAGQRIYSATTLEEILLVIVEEVYVPVLNRVQLWSLEYDAQGQIGGSVLLAVWCKEGYKTMLPLHTRVRFAQAPEFAFLGFDKPVFTADAQRDTRLTPQTRVLLSESDILTTALLPLWASGRQIGMLGLFADEPYHFSEREVRPYIALAHQVAVALENYQLLEQKQETLAETETLYLTTQSIGRAQSFDEIVAGVRGMAEFMGANSFSLRVVTQWDVQNVPVLMDVYGMQQLTDDDQVTGEWQSFMVTGCPVSTALLPFLADPTQFVLFVDAQDLDIAIPDPIRETMLQSGHRGSLTSALVARGKIVGFFSYTTREPLTSLPRRYLDVIPRTLTDQIAVALDNLLLVADAQWRASQLEKLTQLQITFSQAQDETEIVRAIAEGLESHDLSRLTLSYIEVDILGRPTHASIAAVWPEAGIQPDAYSREELQLGERTELENTPLAMFVAREVENVHQVQLIPDVATDVSLRAEDRDWWSAREVRSLMLIPLYYGGNILGVLMGIWATTHEFTETERFIFNRLQESLGAALKVRLTAEEQQRVARESEQRFWQLQTASEVSRYASSILDPDELLRHVVELIKQRFNLYYVGIFLLDDSGHWAVLRAGTGEAGQTMLDRGHKFEIGGESMIGHCIEMREPQLPRVVEEAEVRYGNPLLPETRSEIAFPLISGGRVLGAVTIQSTEPNHFDDQDIIVLGTMTDQIANAIANARLFVESQARLDELQRLQQRYAVETWRGYVDQQDVFGFAYDLNQVTPLDMPVSSSLFVSDWGYDSDIRIRRDTSTREIPPSDSGGHPDTRDLRVARDEGGGNGSSGVGVEAAIRMHGAPVGVLSFEAGEEAREWSEDELAILESVRDQVELALENRLLFEQSQRALAETQRREAEVRFLQEVAAFLNETEDIVAAQDELLERLKTFIPVMLLTLTSYDSDNRVILQLESGAQISEVQTEWTGVQLAASSGPAWVIRENQLLVDDDIRARRRFSEDEALIEQGGVSRIIIPLRLGPRTLGTLGMVSDQESVFSRSGVLTILQQLAAQIASAMERANLFRQTRSALGESQALYRASSTLAQATSYDAVLRGIIEHTLLSRPARAELGLLIPDPETKKKDVLQIVAALSTDPEYPAASVETRIAISEWPALVMLGAGTQFICENVESDPRMSLSRQYYLTQGVHAIILASLEASGEQIGVLQIRFSEPYHPTELENRLYDVTSRQAAVVLRNRQLLQESELRAEQLSAAVQMANLTTSIMERDELLRTSVSFFQDQFRLYYMGIFLLDQVGQWVELRAATGEQGKQLMQMGFRLEVGGGSLIGQCVTQMKTHFSMDVMKEKGYFQNPLLPDTRSEVALPLVSRGQVIGAMSVQRDQRFAFTEDDISTLELMANQLANVIESLNSYERTQNTLTETTALYQIVQRVSDARTAAEVFRVAVEGISQREEADLVVAGILVPPEEPKTLMIVNSWDREKLQFPIIEFPLEKIPRLYESLRMQNRFTSTDATQDPMVDPYVRDIYRRLGVRAMAAFQLDIRGLQYGTIMVHSRKATEFSTAESRFYENIARQAFVALESLNLVETTQAEAERRAILNEVLQTASRALEPFNLMRDVGQVVARRLERPVMMWRWDGEVAAVVSIHSASGRLISEQMSASASTEIPAGRIPFIDKVIRTRQAVHTSIVKQMDQLMLSSVIHDSLPMEEVFAVPLLARGETVVGVMVLGRQPGQDAITDDQKGFIQDAALNIGVTLVTARLYQEAQDTAEKLKEVDQLKNEFLANMSHELRTPLNSIIGFSRVILKGIDGPLTEMQKTDLNAIYQSGQHLLNLINDILDLSKIEAGKMEFVFEPTDLKDIFRGVMSTAIALVKDKPVELLTEVPENLPIVLADSRRIRQVVLNLVSNAAKFTDQGFIRVGATYDDYQVIINVQDTGIGIPADKIDAVFEQFKQVDSSSTRKYGGTGLGVPLSKKFVEQHGGDMWLESVVGEGSVFYFSLPIEGPSAVKPEKEEDEASTEAKTYHTVLTVDDDERVITLFRRYLEKHGYRVFGLTDTTRVLEEAKRLKPYAITLDIIMPNKDGWALIRELKADPDTSDIPIIVCSVVSETDKGLSMGIADYLVKPFSEHDLLEALERLEKDTQDGYVLLVDDNPDDRQLLRRILENAAYEVIEADGGESAIAQIQMKTPSLVVLDLMMPNIDGFAVLENLKSGESTRHIPVIVVTAKELDPKEREHLQQRVASLLEKGIFDQNQLLRDVATALNRLSVGQVNK
ncbi:MAG: GAF domain-containing protein [Anaerolineae bacterium]|nr:GAF domain-containing protein [Anaerolineae bacterium]